MNEKKWINWTTIFKMSYSCMQSDTYKPALKKKLFTNNGKHDAALAPNWNWVDWNYDEVRGRKRVMKVAITTHIARIQKIDEYPALLNVGKEYVYSLGSITDHDLSYVPLNWKDK